MEVFRQNKSISFLLVGAGILYITFLYLDLRAPGQPVSSILKYTCELFCLTIVLLSARHSLSGLDTRLLLAAFCFTLAADAIFLFVHNFALGIAVFMFAHIFYIRRYNKKDFLPCLIAAVVMLAFIGICLAAGIDIPFIFPLGGLYGILIFINAISAFHSKLPRPNKALACVGMVFFLLCDFNVAAEYLLALKNLPITLPNFLEWLFYIPALVLLSLSGYDYTAVRSSSQKRDTRAVSQHMQSNGNP